MSDVPNEAITGFGKVLNTPFQNLKKGHFFQYSLAKLEHYFWAVVDVKASFPFRSGSEIE